MEMPGVTMPSAGGYARARASLSWRKTQKDAPKKQEELARVLERLRSLGLRPGIARELRKHVAILDREIAELTKAGLT